MCAFVCVCVRVVCRVSCGGRCEKCYYTVDPTNRPSRKEVEMMGRDKQGEVPSHPLIPPLIPRGPSSPEGLTCFSNRRNRSSTWARSRCRSCCRPPSRTTPRSSPAAEVPRPRLLSFVLSFALFLSFIQPRQTSSRFSLASLRCSANGDDVRTIPRMPEQQHQEDHRNPGPGHRRQLRRL